MGARHVCRLVYALCVSIVIVSFPQIEKLYVFIKIAYLIQLYAHNKTKMQIFPPSFNFLVNMKIKPSKILYML